MTTHLKTALLWVVLLQLFYSYSNTYASSIPVESSLKQSSSFSYLDNNDFYDDVVDEPSVDLGIHFKPPRLVYENSPICIPAISQFEIHNNLDHSVDILAVISNDPQFHPVLFNPQVIGPESSIIVQILFLPYHLDSSTSGLTIETSEGDLLYHVEGKAVENPYHVHPFTHNRIIIGSRGYQIPVMMYNPHSTTLHIMEVFTTEDFISLSDSQSMHLNPPSRGAKTNNSLDMVWSISPGSEEKVMTITIASLVNPGFQRGYVHIKTDHDKIIVPIEVEFMPGGLHLMDNELSFGVLSNTNEQKSLDILVANDGDENVKIVDVVIEGAGEGLTVVFDDDLMIYADKPYNKIANAVFRSADLRIGHYVGKIVIYTNSTNALAAVLEVPFSAIVLRGGIGFEAENLTYYMDAHYIHHYTQQYMVANRLEAINPEDESLCFAHTQEATFQNHYSAPITIYEAHLQGCQDFVRISYLPDMQEVDPLGSWGPLQLTFCMEKVLHRFSTIDKLTPKTCWLELSTNVSYQRIPVYVTDGRLEVELIDADAKLVQKWTAAANTTSTSPAENVTSPIIQRSAQDDEFDIDLGLMSKFQPRDLRLVISNRNSISNFVGLSATSQDLCICFESSWPIEYFNESPEQMENYICSWPSRTFDYAFQHDKVRCSCHYDHRQESSADFQSREDNIALQAKIRPGYSAMLSIVFSNLTNLPEPSFKTLDDGQKVAIYSLNFTLQSKMQSMIFRVRFMLTEQVVHTIPDPMGTGNGGRFVLGSKSSAVYWSTAAFPEKWNSFILTSDSSLMQVHFSSISPSDSNNVQLYGNLSIDALDAKYHSEEEAVFGPSLRQIWKAEVLFDILSKQAAVKCIEERLHYHPLQQVPSMWAMVFAMFCAVGRSDKFTAQWIDAVKTLEMSRALPRGLDVMEMRALTQKLRLHWWEIHRLMPIDLPPVNIIAKSTAVTHLFTVNHTKLELPVLTMPDHYKIHIPFTPIGQPLSIYLDLVNLYDVEAKLTVFSVGDAAFAFQYQSKSFCEDSVQDAAVDVNFVFDEAIITEILGNATQCSVEREDGTCEAENRLSFDCLNRQCSVPASKYLDSYLAKGYLIAGATKHSWNYQPSNAKECFSPVRHHSLNVTIPPRSQIRAGPIVLVPDSIHAKEYLGSFLIANSFTGYELLELTVKTEKPVVSVQSIHFCDQNDHSHISCKVFANHTSKPIADANSSPSSRNALTSKVPLTHLEQSLIVESTQDVILLYVENGGNVTAMVYDIEVDGQRCTSVNRNGPRENYVKRSECRHLPLKLNPHQTLPIEMSGLLSCSFESKQTHLRIFDHHSKESVIEMDVSLRASGEFAAQCLIVSRHWVLTTLMPVVLLLLLVGSAACVVIMAALFSRAWSKRMIPPIRPDIASTVSMQQSQRVSTILEQTRRMSSAMRVRSTSEEASGGKLMDLSDVQASAPVNMVFNQNVRRLMESRAERALAATVASAAPATTSSVAPAAASESVEPCSSVAENSPQLEARPNIEKTEVLNAEVTIAEAIAESIEQLVTPAAEIVTLQIEQEVVIAVADVSPSDVGVDGAGGESTDAGSELRRELEQTPDSQLSSSLSSPSRQPAQLDGAMERVVADVSMGSAEKKSKTPADEPPPLALASEYIFRPGAPEESSQSLSLDMHHINDASIPALEPSPAHPWVTGSAHSSPDGKPTGGVVVSPWAVSQGTAAIGAPPGLGSVGRPVNAYSRGISDSTDSPVFMYRGQLLESEPTTFSSAPSSGPPSAQGRLYPSQSSAVHPNPSLTATSDASKEVFVGIKGMALGATTLPSVHDIVVSNDDRRYLQSLMASTRSEVGDFSRSWDQLLTADPAADPAIRAPTSIGRASRMDSFPPYRPPTTGNDGLTGKLAPPSGIFSQSNGLASDSSMFSATYSRAEFSSQSNSGVYVPPHLRPRSNATPAWPPANPRLRTSSWDFARTNTASSVAEMVLASPAADLDDLTTNAASAWQSMNDMRLPLNIDATLQPSAVRPLRTRAAQSSSTLAHHEEVSSFFGPGGFFDDNEQDSAFGTLEDDQSNHH